MSKVQVTYNGNQKCTAVDTKNGKRVTSGCSMTKGEEFGPESLVAAGLGSCMLISMSSFAERHQLDVSDARVDVETKFGGKPEMRISALDITVRVPKDFGKDQQENLQAAAEACPIKRSLHPETVISTRYEFGDSATLAG